MGEAGLMSVFAVSAYVCFFAGAMGHDPSFTFCALLAFAASLVAAIILNRHYERPCDYRRRRHLGPTKFGLLMAIWPLDDKEMQSHARRIASTPSIQTVSALHLLARIFVTRTPIFLKMRMVIVASM
ncbi:hypothetical protein [Bradyrhizobium sp. DASA03007]|uniref:hypothetical protein n=1 Tax=unclassified Bradyrhizobium TaxID=2631580 RepID=UPI003F707E38